jgi:hypothetical protein
MASLIPGRRGEKEFKGGWWLQSLLSRDKHCPIFFQGWKRSEFLRPPQEITSPTGLLHLSV